MLKSAGARFAPQSSAGMGRWLNTSGVFSIMQVTMFTVGSKKVGTWRLDE